MNGPAAVLVRPVVWPGDLPAAQRLLRAYQGYLENSPAGAESIRVDGLDDEIANLPEHWGSDSSVFLLAWQGEAPAGCAAVRMLPDRQGAAELKRMGGPPAVRGAGVGRELVSAAAEWARGRGAQELLLDTVPAAMPAAQHLYRTLGFEPCKPYHRSSVPGTVFLRLQLAPV